MSDIPLYESPAAAIQRLSHDNWQIAEVYADMWRQLDALEVIEREYIETHPLYPKRRPPDQGIVDALSHPSRQTAERAIPQQPVGFYPDGGLLWVRFQAVHQHYEPIDIAIDADSRESAILGYQMLMLLVQDPAIYHDLVAYRIHRIRFRQDLDQLGRMDGNGVFSIRTTQAIPWMCRVAAHQLGHYRHGNSDFEADVYARSYVHRNHLRFEQWRSHLPRPVADPKEIMQRGLQIIQRHAPDSYQEVRGFRLEPNEQTPDADEYNIAHQLGFIALQRQTQRETGLPMPLEMPDCVAHRSVNVNRPLEVTDPGTSQVIPIERDHPPTPDSERPGLLKEPLFTYGGNTPQEGYHYGYYEIQSPEGMLKVAIDADSYESARLGYLCLELLCRDPICRRDMIQQGIRRVRFRSPLIYPDESGTTVWGYCDHGGVFSIEARQNVASMARVAAHELRHHIGHDQGYDADHEREADQYANEFGRRMGIGGFSIFEV